MALSRLLSCLGEPLFKTDHFASLVGYVNAFVPYQLRFGPASFRVAVVAVVVSVAIVVLLLLLAGGGGGGRGRFGRLPMPIFSKWIITKLTNIRPKPAVKLC